MKIDPLKEKYWPLYWDMAYLAARQSVATRHQVGAVVVTPSGMISVGWNAMPAGMSNGCEKYQFVPEEGEYRMKTKPEVIHAERNAINKMTNQGISTQGAMLFVTRSPCPECCKAIYDLGFKTILFDELHDDTSGFRLLRKTGNLILKR